MSCSRLGSLLIIAGCLLRYLPVTGQAVIANGYSIIHYNSDNALPQNSITGMAFDKNGFLWLATQMGVVRFDGKNFREYNKENCQAMHWNEFSLVHHPSDTSKLYFVPTADTSRLLSVNDDYQLVADSVDGALHRQLLQQLHTLQRHTIPAAGWPVKDIACLIYRPEHQQVFIGSMTTGLYVLKLHEVERLFFNQPRFAANSQASQVELPGSRILTCTGVLNYRNKKQVPFAATRKIDKHVMLQAADGAIWYSADDSLRKTDAQLQSFKAVKRLGYYLTGIIETANNELIYSNKHQVFRRTALADTLLVDGLRLSADDEIAALRMISPHLLWIGTTAGLFSYDVLTKVLHRIPEMDKKAVSVIHVARDSSIWLGTYGQGLYKYYDDKFVAMPLDSRNSLSTAHCFLEDRLGYFWIPGNKGLFRVAKKELDDYAKGLQSQVYYYYVDRSYGFNTNEFNACTPCGLTTRDGWFSIPSIDGLVRFNPDSLSINLPDNPILIEQVLPGNRRMVVSKELTARQDAGSLIFEISSPYFGNSVNLHLEYAIKGLNNTWYPVNDDGKLIITSLGSGKYTLVVRSRHLHGRYAYNELRLTIPPYWYQQLWFICVLGICAIGTFLLFFRLRYNYQVKKAQLLQQKVDERTAQLSESNRVKELMISAILHDLRSPLRFLHLLARRLYNDHKASADKGLSHLLLQFENATNEIYDFTQDFFVFINLQKEGFVIKRQTVILRELVNEILSLYEMGAKLQNNTLHNQVPERVILETDANLLSLVVRNLVDNANKYTREGVITIGGIQDEHITRIVFTDEGDGMGPELIACILDKSYNPAQQGMGWGYKIIIEILSRLQGTLDIVSDGRQGNVITITFENTGQPVNDLI